MTTDLSIIHLFLGASPIVQLVMLALLLVSFMSWFVIFHRGKVLRLARRDADAFEQRFWSGTELGSLFKEVSRDDYAASGMERIFEAGFREFARLRRKEGGAGQATIAMVAPGIAEALVATAMGLFAAIPAVIAYNRFANDAERLGNRYENFLEEFAAVLQRQAGA